MPEGISPYTVTPIEYGITRFTLRVVRGKSQHETLVYYPGQMMLYAVNVRAKSKSSSKMQTYIYAAVIMGHLYELDDDEDSDWAIIICLRYGIIAVRASALVPLMPRDIRITWLQNTRTSIEELDDDIKKLDFFASFLVEVAHWVDAVIDRGRFPLWNELAWGRKSLFPDHLARNFAAFTSAMQWKLKDAEAFLSGLVFDLPQVSCFSCILVYNIYHLFCSLAAQSGQSHPSLWHWISLRFGRVQTYVPSYQISLRASLWPANSRHGLHPSRAR
jgi:hypothetical protein